ncbi:Aerobic cobaltochelatase subunit CobT [Alphaproteobacteria bacterium SO-S41]|nr:Aerobic cobaltochelatase subunit CobT [Alphaproteobacteria bacterium SO-S41]
MPRPSWRCDLKLMAERWVLKENIDGEALEWAWQRAQAFAPSTWLCVVISDGAPVDDATILANGDTSTNWYLQQHLESVIARMSGLTSVRLGGLGLLHKVPWYPRNVEAKDLEEVPAAAIHLLEQLIWQDEQAPS